ncbi:MAG: hypothetical protein A3F09_02985 [Chlamydiae bacterium RIFCSPHIGHO2_12_FULL_49_11]|nr:MAG: hypothetical protein A3F09_02985 [Chlamydiae bacterium RIFCSPHIGHO2_12_FULL_49_11]
MVRYNFTKIDRKSTLEEIGKEKALLMLSDMLLIRHFEQRGEQSYQMGKVWGFYHSYIGQEAIQTGAVYALGRDHTLWATTYRCHALALLLGMTVEEGMCELYGKANGNAKGRGGSMHMYTSTMAGGSGIVGAQWPLGVGLAFSIKYKKEKDKVAVVFGGDGAVMMGTYPESLNLACLHKLPLIIVIENNQFSMGTHLERGVAHPPLGENTAKAFGLTSYTIDGMDLISSWAVFQAAKKDALTQEKPVIIETVGHRFRGHSISDAALYRSKEELKRVMELDPIPIFLQECIDKGWITEEEYKDCDTKKREKVQAAMKFADESPWPDIGTLEEGVFAP